MDTVQNEGNDQQNIPDAELPYITEPEFADTVDNDINISNDAPGSFEESCQTSNFKFVHENNFLIYL